jgi:ABC-type multidrug transport system ATPase subunit
MMLDGRHIGVRYGSHVAVEDVSMTARPGEVLALLGANGSGKSSLLRALGPTGYTVTFRCLVPGTSALP